MMKLLNMALAVSVALAMLPAHAGQPRPSVALPGVVQTVQSNESFRIVELEDKVRQLTGQVEELNFLLLQMQEKLRQLEEENELRFQELEDKRSGLPETDTNAAQDGGEDTNRLGKSESSEASAASDANDSTSASSSSSRIVRSELPKLEPRALGTLTFDADGNVVDSRSDDQKALAGLPTLFGEATEGAVEASQFGATPSQVFAAGKSEMDARNFKRAQQAFAAHLKAWPNDPDAGVVKYYLGEAYFWQKDYYHAADSYLEAHNNYPEAETAADNLLALGLALAGLNQREVACATYAEVLKQYPEAEPRLGPRVRDEQVATKC